MLHSFLKIDNVGFAFSKTKRGLERFNQARTVFFCDRGPVLNDLDPRAESLDLRRIVDTHHVVVDPNAEITLLLKEFEKLSRLGFRRNRNPEGDENVFVRAIAHDFRGD